MTLISRNDFDFIRDLAYKHSAIVLEVNKKYLVESRLMPLVQKEGLASLQELIAKLRTQKCNSLLSKVVDALTINETLFFRDGHPFETLRTHILPAIVAKLTAVRMINIWCAACSSGQEPFSIAMLIHEYFPKLINGVVQIYATDLSNEMVTRAVEGRYSQLEVSRGLPPAFLGKYFEKHETGWQLKQCIRDMVNFRQANLAGTWPSMPNMDLIFMRNVLIYFDMKTKKKILGKAHKLLKPQGYLFLGTAEISNLDDTFERVLVGKSVCYRSREALRKPQGDLLEMKKIPSQ